MDKTTDIEDLPFDKAMHLFTLRRQAERDNDIALRTRLLRKHPSLFNDDKMAKFLEIEQMLKAFLENRKNRQAALEDTSGRVLFLENFKREP